MIAGTLTFFWDQNSQVCVENINVTKFYIKSVGGETFLKWSEMSMKRQPEVEKTSQNSALSMEYTKQAKHKIYSHYNKFKAAHRVLWGAHLKNFYGSKLVCLKT